MTYKKGIIGLLVIAITMTGLITDDAFGAITSPATLDSVVVGGDNESVDIVCTDPTLTGMTIITGYQLDFDDDTAFGSIDLTDNTSLTCDSSTLNNIDTSSLTDLTTYSVQLTVSTDDSGDSIDSILDAFIQPDNELPVITPTGASATVELELVNSYVEAGAVTTDNDPAYVSNVGIGGDVVDTSVVGVYIVTYEDESVPFAVYVKVVVITLLAEHEGVENAVM